MIVWGGYDGSSFLNTGGRYDPSSNSWTPTNTVGAPAGRYDHTGVWTGSQMIVWGGINNGGTQNDGGRYTPSTNSWLPTNTATAPTFRRAHAAVWTGSEMIIWARGFPGSTFYNTRSALQPNKRYLGSNETPLGRPLARNYPSSVWTDSEMVVWGGKNGSTDMNTGGRYNPSSDSWIPTQHRWHASGGVLSTRPSGPAAK